MADLYFVPHVIFSASKTYCCTSVGAPIFTRIFAKTNLKVTIESAQLRGFGKTIRSKFEAQLRVLQLGAFWFFFGEDLRTGRFRFVYFFGPR